MREFAHTCHIYQLKFKSFSSCAVTFTSACILDTLATSPTHTNKSRIHSLSTVGRELRVQAYQRMYPKAYHNLHKILRTNVYKLYLLEPAKPYPCNHACSERFNACPHFPSAQCTPCSTSHPLVCSRGQYQRTANGTTRLRTPHSHMQSSPRRRPGCSSSTWAR